jgi:hypothetical protein
MGIAATAFVFELGERNPKRIKRWPYPCLADTPNDPNERTAGLWQRQVKDQAKRLLRN